MARHRTNTHYAGSCCEWCDDHAQGRAIGNIPPEGMINGQRCADWMCTDPNYCMSRGYGQTYTTRPSLTNAPVQDYNGFYGANGVTLSQHGDGDENFPGWQETFGEGTFLGDTDFPNDDASHLSVDEGYTATLREHGPSDDRYPGNEYTYTGPTTMNLNDFNDELSELQVDKLPDSDDNQDNDTSPSTDFNDEVIDAGPDGVLGTSDDIKTLLSNQEPPKDNSLMYIVGGVCVLALLGLLYYKKSKSTTKI
tara:strand:- start:1295 stop:2047 length:753 start_codon:yes stop_codon:yes gene_type:complete